MDVEEQVREEGKGVKGGRLNKGKEKGGNIEVGGVGDMTGRGRMEGEL